MRTLGSLYPGRVFLGVGTGESMNEVPVTGVTWPGFAERIGRLKEAIELMQRLWTEDRVSYEGRYYQTIHATVYDKPEQPVPLYVAASGAKAAELAGQVADGFICTSGKGPELYCDTLLPAVERGAQAAGRDPARIEKMIEVKVSFDHDRQRAMADTRFWAALALPAEDKAGVEDPIEMEKRADALPIEKAASRFIVSTDPDEHVEQIGAYVELGFRHLVFHAPGPNPSRFLDSYAREILPRLRERYG